MAKSFLVNQTKYIIAAAVLLGLLIIIIICCMCKRKLKKSKKTRKETIKLSYKEPEPRKVIYEKIQPDRNELSAMHDLGSLKFVLQYDTVKELLMISILRGIDIPVSDLSGYGYLYVAAKCLPLHVSQTTEFQTTPVHAKLSPKFNETIRFKVESSQLEEQVLYLYLYEMNRWIGKEGKGQLSILLKGLGLEMGEEHSMSMELKPYDQLHFAETGKLDLEIKYDFQRQILHIKVVKVNFSYPDELTVAQDLYVSTEMQITGEKLPIKSRTNIAKLKPKCDEVTFGDAFTYKILEIHLLKTSLRARLKRKKRLKGNVIVGTCVIPPNSDYWTKLLQSGDADCSDPVHLSLALSK